jgi:Zn-dependent protease with chaperone function
MIVAALENFVIFHTVLSAAAFLVMLAIRYGWWRKGISSRFLIAAYTAALVVPPACAAWIVTAAFVPAWLAGVHGSEDSHVPAASVHLIHEVSIAIEPFLGYAVIAMAAGSFALTVLFTLTSCRRTAWAIRCLAVGVPPATDAHKVAVLDAASRRHGIEVTVLASDRPLSFVSGLGRPVVAVSSGTLRALSVDQLAGLVEHEVAHHERHDNRMSLALRLIGALSCAVPVTRALLRWRSEQVELVCDEIAASRTCAPLDIAEALVALRRATAPTAAMWPLAVASFVPDDRGAVARRVGRLLQLADKLPVAAPPSVCSSLRLGAATAAIFSASLVVLAASSPFAVHAAVESFLSLLR